MSESRPRPKTVMVLRNEDPYKKKRRMHSNLELFRATNPVNLYELIIDGRELRDHVLKIVSAKLAKMISDGDITQADSNDIMQSAKNALRIQKQ